MKKTTTLLPLATFLFIAGTLFGQTRYVSNAGNDGVGNDCTDINSPCLTIHKANIEAATGDAILVAPGNYTLTSTLNLSKPTLTLSALDSMHKPIIMSTQNEVINVSAPSITISNLVFKMGLTTTSGMKGIVGTSGFNNLTISGNEFYSTNPGGFLSTGMVFGAYAILLHTGTTPLPDVLIKNNKVSVDQAGDDAFGRGIGIGFSSSDGKGPGGVISGNDIAAYYTIQSIRESANMIVSNNILRGMCMFNDPKNSSITTINNNTFTGVSDQYASSIFTLMDIRTIHEGNIIVSNSDFKNYLYSGIYCMASKNVSILGNTFTPSDSANQFVSLGVNTKLMTAGHQNNNYANEISIKGNTFNPGLPGKGTAITFSDHYGGTTPAFGTVTVGGPALVDRNVFDTLIGHYIELDSLSGSSDSLEIWNPTTFGGEHTPPTTMKPVSQNIIALASNNSYGYATVQQIEAKNIDSLDVSGLGKIILGYVSGAGVMVNNIATAKLYPNPATHQLHISLNGNAISATVQITDVLGNVMYKNTMKSSKTIDVSNFHNGVYFIKIREDNQFLTKRFIKE